MEITGDKGITLQDVQAGKNSLEEFVAQLSVEEMAQIVRGEGLSNPRVIQVQLLLLAVYQMHCLVMVFRLLVVQTDQVDFIMMVKQCSFQFATAFHLHGMIN